VLGALAGCWTAGGPLDFAALPGQPGRRIPLPTYPYQRRRHWVDGTVTEAAEVAEPAAPSAGPVDETVARISRIWTELLGADAAEPSVNFLELGGTSLTAIQLLTRLRRDFGVRLSLRAVFDNPTIDGIADLVRAKAGAR
jgi:acyl transferase domain-containing protein